MEDRKLQSRFDLGLVIDSNKNWNTVKAT